MRLDPQARDYLAAFEAEEAAPPEGAASRTWAAIVDRLEEDAPIEELPFEQPARPARWVWAALGVCATAAALIVWHWASIVAVARLDVSSASSDHSAGYSRESDPPEQRAEVRTRRAQEDAPRTRHVKTAALVPVEPQESRVELEESIDNTTIERAAAPKGTPRSRGKRKPPPPASNLSQAELRLFDRARAAATHGDPARALALVAEHEGLYPDSIFADERHVARAQALCRRGDRTAARKVAEAFIRRNGRSHLVPKMRSICSPASTMTETP